MNFQCPSLMRYLLVLVATAGVVLSASAQHQGQPIIFSAPDSETATDAAPSLAPVDVKIPQLFPGSSAPLISTPPSLQPPPLPVVIVTPAQTTAAQQEYDRKKNWALMTPAEILGVPTLESVMGVSEHNAAGGEKKDQTVLERYFERQQSDEKTMMTNQMANFNAPADWSLQGRTQPELNRGFSAVRDNSLFGTAQDRSLNGNPGGVATWSSSFNSQNYQTISPMTQTPEQAAAAQAAAEDFQKLLQPHLAMPTTQTTPSTAPNALSLYAKPAASPVGNSFIPVSSGVITPQGVTPLFGPPEKNSSTTPVTSQWKRKLPPWRTGPGADQNY